MKCVGKSSHPRFSSPWKATTVRVLTLPCFPLQLNESKTQQPSSNDIVCITSFSHQHTALPSSKKEAYLVCVLFSFLFAFFYESNVVSTTQRYIFHFNWSKQNGLNIDSLNSQEHNREPKISLNFSTCLF